MCWRGREGEDVAVKKQKACSSINDNVASMQQVPCQLKSFALVAALT